MNIDHIGYLVADIKKSIQLFHQLGYIQKTGVYTDNISTEDTEARNVYICFLKNGPTTIELVSPINDRSDVYSRLKRHGEGPYHICYQVGDLEESIQILKKSGWMVLKSPADALAFNGARVAFLVKNGAGLIELVETKECEDEASGLHSAQKDLCDC